MNSLKDPYPLISIVTVVYDGARFIEATLESVQTQTYELIEHWVIDGGSTDGTVDIVRRHASNLAGWLSEPDEGISDAFNKGIDRSVGEYMMFLNADDALVEPGAIGKMVEIARRHAWPDVIYGDCDLYDPETDAFLYRASIEYDKRRFLNRETLPHPSMLMRRRYFDRFGKFDKSFRIAMDFELFLRGIPTVGAVHAPLVVTKVRAGGISARDRSKVIEESIRALKINGHISKSQELRVRIGYGARGISRRVLECLGLYTRFVALRGRFGAKQKL